MSKLSDTERATMQSELAALEKQLAEVNARIDKNRASDQNDFDDLRIRNARRSDEQLASFRKTSLGQLVERMAFNDNGSTREQIQAAQDNSSLTQMKKLLGSMKEGDYTSDPQIKTALEQLRVSSLLYQYYSANYHDAAQDRLFYDMPKWALGYQFGGPMGAGLAILASLNQSMSSEANYMQLNKMRASMTTDYLRLLNTTNIFAMNKSQGWLENEQMRGATSVDPVIGRARIEFQSMVAPPYKEYGQAQNLRMKFEPAFIEATGKNRNEQRRLGADLMFGLGGLPE